MSNNISGTSTSLTAEQQQESAFYPMLLNTSAAKSETREELAERISAALPGFIGTTGYYKHAIIRGSRAVIYLTDGTRYLAEEAQCYWLMDLVLSVRPKLDRVNDLIIVRVKCLKRSRFFVEFGIDIDAEGNMKGRVYSQVIHYSDFPLDEIKLYYSEGVLYLPSEH